MNGALQSRKHQCCAHSSGFIAKRKIITTQPNSHYANEELGECDGGERVEVSDLISVNSLPEPFLPAFRVRMMFTIKIIAIAERNMYMIVIFLFVQIFLAF